MRLLKFQAASLKDAIAKVKAELGPDAMVVATRDVKRGLLGTGVEVTAAIDDVDMSLEGPGTDLASTKKRDLSALSDRDVERIMTPLRSELRSIRTELAPISAAEAQKIRAELSALRHALVSMRPFAPGVRNDAHQEALLEIAKRSAIARAPEKRILALVGPTGVGKTTTIAKLAARAALEQNQTVALVSVDTYRVGGEQQMRIFAELIGVPLVVVRSLSDLASTIEGLSSYERVFIDTAGRSPRDKNPICELVRALLEVDGLEIHLAVPATFTAQLVDEWVRTYGAINVDRLLFTKIDEAPALTELVEAPARVGRPISFITTGQRVPEDIETATPERLLELAGRGFVIEGEEVAA